MFDFLDPLESLDVAWSAWPELAAANPCFVAQFSGPAVNGHEVPVRLSGAFVVGARTICGLRLWDDAAEGVSEDGIGWSLFEVEKLIRMMLHQSGLAFETLASSRVWADGFDGRRIVEAAATSGIICYYADIATPLAEGQLIGELWRWRSLLTGLSLARDGGVSFQLPTLLDRLNEPTLAGLAGARPPDSRVARELLDEMTSLAAPLPERVSDYDWLDGLVADLRLGT